VDRIHEPLAYVGSKPCLRSRPFANTGILTVGSPTDCAAATLIHVDKAEELARNFQEGSEAGPEAMLGAQVYALNGIGRALIAVSSELSEICGELQTTQGLVRYSGRQITTVTKDGRQRLDPSC
jgi:hypothetical protein